MVNLYQKIEAYLRGKLTKKEKNQFEKDMVNDPEMKKAAILYSLGESPVTTTRPEEQQIRQLIGRLRSESGSPSTPVIPIGSRIRYFYYRPYARALTAAIALLLFAFSAWLWINPTSNGKWVAEYMIHPNYGATAGVQADLNLKQKAANLYGEIIPGGENALKALAGTADSFNIANFYLAHWYLKSGDYEQALAELEKSTKNASTLNLYDSGFIQLAQFNLILAKLGNKGSKEEVIGLLDEYLDEYPNDSNALALKNELE